MDMDTLKDNINIPQIEYFTSNPKGHLLEKHVKNTFPEFYKILMEYPKELKFSERIYWYYHDITERPICPVCNKKHPKFISFSEGYLQFCSHKCSMQSTERVKKIRATTLKRYGVGNASQSEEIKRRKIETLKKHYGENINVPLQVESIKQKQKSTILKRYGVGNASQSEEIKRRKIETLKKHYGDGVTSTFKIPGMHDKILRTIRDKYGVDCVFELYRRNARNNYYQKFHKNNEIVKSVEEINDEIWYICRCTHPECNKCDEKEFRIQNKQYNSRKYGNVELCTKLLPSQNDKFYGTTLEIFIRNILDSLNINYQTNNRKILSGKELDIYIPSNNIAIECNGVYWHSLKEPTFHYEKWKQCMNKGIHLLTIWEDQIINKPEIIRGIITSYLGIYDKRIYARQCSIKEVGKKESIDFLEKNHLQGSVGGSIRFGLYYKDELMSLMVFGKKRKALGSTNKKDTWELYRYCNKLGVQIIGGASRLFNHFLKEHPCCVVESFSSNDISIGELYRKLGFGLIGEQKYSYWYIDKLMQRHHRYSFRKDILVKNGADPNLTELEITSNMGLYKIYDSGQQKWGYNSKKNTI